MRNLFFTLSLALLGACGVGPGSTPATYYEYLRARYQVGCELQLRCCGVECGSVSDQSLARNDLASVRLIEAGRYVLDTAIAQTCLDAMRAQTDSCDIQASAVPSIPSECTSSAGALVGTTGIGAACIPGNSWCVKNGYCDVTSKTCVKYLNVNENCTTGACDPKLYCDPTAKICKAYPKNGESCANGVPCDNTGPKLVCLPSNLCGPPIEDGLTCATGSQCKSGTCSGTPLICGPTTTLPQTVRNAVCRNLK